MLSLVGIGRVCLLVTGSICLAGCGDYTIQLPNGYFVARVYSGAFFIVNPQNRGVTRLSRNGISIAVVGDIVVGEIDPSSGSGGFFVIDTRTNDASINLSQARYLQTLRGHGIKAPPRLIPAGRFTTLRTLRVAL